MSADAEVRIHTLRLRGPEHARPAVAGALERADWSRVADEEVLILRKILVGGPLPDIGRLTLDQARTQRARAVPGWDARADQAEAVRFASRSDMLACLVRDLSRRDPPRWFWRGWRALFDLPSGKAIAQAMSADARHWSAVFQHLQARGAAEILWRTLEPADAQHLLLALERTTGWPVGRALAPPSGTKESGPAPIAAGLVPDWVRRVTTSHPAHSDSALARLAIVTWLWRSAPQMLSDRDAGARIERLLEAMLSPTPPHRGGREHEASASSKRGGTAPAAETPGGAPSRRATGSAPLETRTGGNPESDTEAIPVAELLATEHHTQIGLDEESWQAGPAVSPSQPPPLAGEVFAPSPLVGRAGVGRTREGKAMEKAVPLQTEALPPAIAIHLTVSPPQALTPQEAPPAETRFITFQGGWFLLLNALALPAIQARLRARETDGSLALGWIWLYRLGHALGGRADPPLAAFLARAAGLPDPEALAALAPLPHEEELVRLTRARFGEAVCDAELFPVPALVLATPSHLDAHYRMSDIRLDVRRAALDIDPGWLPWLGRVVRFHYGHAPELMGLAPRDGSRPAPVGGNPA